MKNKKGFKVGDEVKVKRRARNSDYRWIYANGYKMMMLFTYLINKKYTIKELRPQGVTLNNCAVIPNHLLVKV